MVLVAKTIIVILAIIGACDVYLTLRFLVSRCKNNNIEYIDGIGE